MFLNYFEIKLVVLSVISGNITISSFTLVIGAPAALYLLYYYIFTLSSGFAKLFLSKLKSKKRKHKKIEY